MKTFDIKALLVTLALVFPLTLLLPSSADARPTQDATCTICHTIADDGDGQISAPASIDIALDGSGTLTFSLSSSPQNSAIALFDLDQAGLGATAGAGWTLNTAANPDYEYSDIFANTTTTYDVTLSVPGTALIGTYTIDVIYAGDIDNSNLWNDTTSFNVNVVPIPAAVWLFGSGLLGLVAIARRRRNS